MSDTDDKSKPGPTGNYPNGKLSENDRGEIAIKISAQERLVFMSFGVPVTDIGFKPFNARDLAFKLFEYADKAEQQLSTKTKLDS